MRELPLPTVIACLSRAEAFRDFGTNVHERRAAQMIARLADEVGLPPVECRQIADAAIVHDIGKFAIPIELLQKSSSLSPEEVALIKTHARAGHEILRTPSNPLITLAAEIALRHHERFDGTGYPDGLSGNAIPLPAQIVSICDTYDALRQDRPYRRGKSHEDTMRIIVNGDGRTKPEHFAPRIWSAFQSVADDVMKIFDAADQPALGFRL